jgi:16S rRNA processing protein RimM
VDELEERLNSPATERDLQWVVLGRVSGLFGVRGWVKVFSHTAPGTNILEYPIWNLLRPEGRVEARLTEGQAHGKGIIAHLEGYDDRDRAMTLVGADIAVRREQLPEPDENEFYWVDLEGLRVQTCDGVELGRVDHLFETGANDVMVVRGDRERLIPYVDGIVIDVDLEHRAITVDWDPDF